MYVSNSFKKYDGYKALKILEVISILTFKKRFTKNVRCIYIYIYKTCQLLQPCPHKYTFQT